MIATAARTSRQRRARARLAGLGLAVVGLTGALVAGPVIPGATLAAHAAISCAPNVTVFVWAGSANDTAGHVGDAKTWDNPYNWDVDCTPGLRFEPHDDDVTIPATGKVTIKDGV